jgi:hypothetical protein
MTRKARSADRVGEAELIIKLDAVEDHQVARGALGKQVDVIEAEVAVGVAGDVDGGRGGRSRRGGGSARPRWQRSRRVSRRSSGRRPGSEVGELGEVLAGVGGDGGEGGERRDVAAAAGGAVEVVEACRRCGRRRARRPAVGGEAVGEGRLVGRRRMCTATSTSSPGPPDAQPAVVVAAELDDAEVDVGGEAAVELDLEGAEVRRRARVV